MKQRTEKVLLNAKDRTLAKGYPLVALQANRRANSASNDTQSIINTNDEIIDDTNTDNAAINADNISNAATDGKKSDDAAMSDNVMA